MHYKHYGGEVIKNNFFHVYSPSPSSADSTDAKIFIILPQINILFIFN